MLSKRRPSGAWPHEREAVQEGRSEDANQSGLVFDPK